MSLQPESTKDRYLDELKTSFMGIFVEGGPGLQRVENRMLELLVADAPYLVDISKYLLSLGGKRVRPLLTILSAKLFDVQELSQQVIDAAAGIELIHMATLLHDDIIDESPLRRSQPSAYTRFGLVPTLLTGDFLLVKAFGLCAKLDRFVVESTEAACIELTEGEILEGHIHSTRELDLKQYERIIQKKTASLFTLSASVGAHLAGASAADVARLAAFGTSAGLAFQMIDDILDVTADATLLGKPAGTDLKQRTPSLINLLWLEEEPERARAFFDAPHGEHDWQGALEHLRESAVVERARRLAQDYAAAAREPLAALEHPSIRDDIRQQLLTLLEYTLERCL